MEHSVNLSTLIKASLAAVALAAIALATLILPAEYNIDPTGIGQRLGLTVLAPTTDTEAADPPALRPAPTSNKTARQQVIEITVPANRGIEYKLQMARYDKVTYEWMTDGRALYFDLHGEPEGDTTGYFESYAVATLNSMKGSFTAPFKGSHGWYWKNTSNHPVAVQLILSGQFQFVGLKP